MKKKVFVFAMSGSLLFSSCIGSFSAFNGLKDWNLDVTGSKFVNELIFIALNIIPVYGLFGFGDIVIFNSVEFWTGNNPIGMKEGEKKIEKLEKNGKTYQVTTTRNHVNIEVLAGENVGEQIDLKFIPAKNAWIMEKDGKKIKLSDYKDGVNYVYLPNGTAVEINAKTTEQAIAQTQALAEKQMGFLPIAQR